MQKNQRNAALDKGPCGFEKVGGKRVPTSSAGPKATSRTVYTSGPARQLQKPIYGSTPKSTVTPQANKQGGSRKTDVVGQNS